MKTGRCECGSVTFQSEGPWRDIITCHCKQCRRTTGHFWAATAVPADVLTITNNRGLKWFRSSDTAKRGFCTGCGASLFYQRDGADYIAVGAGCLDDPTDLKLVQEVFTADKGDYYALTPGIAHHETWSKGWRND